MKRVDEWKVYIITDRELSRGRSNEEVIRQAICGGADAVQLRDKGASTVELYKEAVVLRSLTKNMDTSFIINDRVDVALAVDADGIHLGQDDLSVSAARRILGSDKIVGLSTHSFQQAHAASEEKVDYISLGPIFQTQTKETDQPVGVSLIRRVKESVSLPVVAIGGIREDNVKEVLRAGATCVAVISAAVSADDIEASVRRLKQKVSAVDVGENTK